MLATAFLWGPSVSLGCDTQSLPNAEMFMPVLASPLRCSPGGSDHLRA
jgi:hypothetical protein